MWIVGFFFLTIILDNVLDDSTYLLSSDIIPIAVMLIIWLSLMNYKYRKLKKKEALRISGKIITVKVEKIFSKYVGKQWTKYYLTAVSDLYPHQNFTEEFSKKEYDFLMKHLESGSKLEMFVDYENSKLFYIDFKMIQRDYEGKPEKQNPKAFGVEDIVISNIDFLKVGGVMMMVFGLLFMIPLILFYSGVLWDGIANEDGRSAIFGSSFISVILILIWILLLRKSTKKNTSKQYDPFSSHLPPKGFDGFPS